MNVSSNASFPQGVIQATAGDEESQRGAGGAGHRGKGENLIQSGAGKVAGDMKGSLDRRELESVQERSVEQSEVSRADAASRDRESSLQFPRSEGLLGQSSQLVNIDKSSSIADYENLLAIEREKNLLAQPESRDSSLLQKGSPQRMFQDQSMQLREANQELLVRYEALQKEFKEKEHSLSQAQGKILRLTGNQRVFDELRRENEAFRKPRDQKAFNSKGTENYEYGIAPQTSTQVINEVMAELEVKTYPELQQRIREIVQLNKQANKFTDAISALVADMGGVPKSRLTLKQAWKWIKRVLEDYMVLKKSLGEGGSYYGGEHSERQTMRLVEQYLRVENERAVLPRLTHLLVESEVMERIIDKIRAFFQIDHNVALNELEKILDVEYLGNHGSLLQSPPPHHHHESHYKPRAPGKSFKH
eukprot:TRINITY_DN3636_c0_g1_i2.p1 TRINITY_DN3636_c0_g1~~TRINITY_DN3636_c0_g1_i2.p1  ORF type:complete len:419 (-),score=80.80 TRINITY_DN3636_c0_g1_i2:148-1404(-)